MIREAQFLQWALNAVDRVEPDKREDYLRYVRNASSLLITSGALQTTAFLNAKGGVHARVAQDLAGAPGMPPNFTPSLANAKTREYIQITRVMRRALTYLKLAAEMARAAQEQP